MGYFTLDFENKELEQMFQQQQSKYILKCANLYFVILIIGKPIAIVDQYLNQQIYFFALTLTSHLTDILMFYLMRKQKLGSKAVTIYLSSLCYISMFIQILGQHYRKELNIGESFMTWMDVIHQCVVAINFGQSHIMSSIAYTVFIITRVYIQVNIVYTNVSLTFMVFGLFYITDQYKKAKQRRKQFLKSQKNMLLEKFIQEFINEKVCIVEKDENNVKFVPVVINDSLQVINQDINNIIKQITICESKQLLSHYLYGTLKNYETFLCKFQNQIYEVTYQLLILNKCLVFIKMTQIYQKKTEIDYKDLFQKYTMKLKNLTNQLWQGKIINNKMETFAFIYQFQKYHLIYKTRLDMIKIKSLVNILKNFDFEIIYYDINLSYLINDKYLLYFLIKLIKKSMIQRQIKIHQEQQLIQVECNGIFANKQIRNQVNLINKMLFHIGQGLCTVIKKQDNAGVISFNLLNLELDN